MTRINVGIPPKELSREHLIAEHREIKRIPNHLKKHGPGCVDRAPANFKLGEGHVLFFINKGQYTFRRYMSLYEECLARGYNIQYYGDAWWVYNSYLHLYKNWQSSEADAQLIRDRIESNKNQ